MKYKTLSLLPILESMAGDQPNAIYCDKRSYGYRLKLVFTLDREIKWDAIELIQSLPHVLPNGVDVRSGHCLAFGGINYLSIKFDCLPSTIEL